MTSVGDGSFGDCTSLTSANLGAGVASLGKAAFYNCSALTNVQIPATMQTVGSQAFYGCSAMSQPNFADYETLCGISFADPTSNPASLAHRLFVDGSEVTNAIIPDGIAKIGDFSFCDVTALQSVTLPATLDSIGDYSFAYCPALTTVQFPDNLKSIGRGAFCYCSGLTSADLPNGLANIGYHAFGACENLQQVSLPSSIAALGELSFEQCNALNDVFCYSVSVPDASDAFLNSSIKSATLHVPAAAIDSYRAAATWRSFARIVAIDTADGINEVNGNVNGKPANRVCYDLAGRRISTPVRGLNIINGRKVLVK